MKITLVRGMSPRNPNVSVKKPGVISKIPDINITNPSNIV
jgi:hypothetical protein